MSPITINQRLKPLFDEFCHKYCKHFAGRLCRKNKKVASLDNCPIGEWWDINDYLNKVNRIVNMIKQKYDVGTPKGKLKDLE